MEQAISTSQPLLKAALAGIECGRTQDTAGHEMCGVAPDASEAAADIPVMVSGAGHDAMAIADIAKVSMLCALTV